MSDDQQATLLAIPVLAGAFLRIVLGIFVDKFGAKKTALVSQLIVIATLFLAYINADSITYNQLVACCLGSWFCRCIVCRSTSTSGSMVSAASSGNCSWESQVREISVLLSIFCLLLRLQKFGDGHRFSWSVVFSPLLSLLPICFWQKMHLLSVYKPNPKKLGDYMKLMRDKDTWWFNLFYAVSFGGFIGFANYMKVYLMNTYQADMSAFGIDIMNEEQRQSHRWIFRSALYLCRGNASSCRWCGCR